MIDLEKISEEEPCDHILMVKELVRETIDMIGEEHPSLRYYEIIAALELLKLEVYEELTEPVEIEEME